MMQIILKSNKYGLSVLILLFGVCDSIHFDNNSDYEQTNFPNNVEVEEGLLTNGSDISTRCIDHLLQYSQDVKSGKLWALKMFDASAKLISSGILDRNTVDFGSFDECLSIKHDINGTIIHGKYCITKLTINISKVFPTLKLEDPTLSEKIDFKLAKCFPDSCTAADLQKVYKYYNLEMVIDENLCQTKADQPKLDTGGIFTIIVYGIILWIVVVSTAYDVVLHYLKTKPSHSLLVVFSAFTNIKKLLAVTSNPNEITCLHGIRVMNTMWIMLFHVYCVRYEPLTKNFYQCTVDVILIVSASLAVDTFFLLGGLLVSYIFIDATAKGAKFNIFIHFIHRYIRLTPALAVVMVFQITLIKFIGSGPYWPNLIQRDLAQGCEINWWKALLFIQNIFGRKEPMCIPHSWYLSTDMQFFLLSPLLLLPLKRFSRVVLSVTGCLSILSTIICFLLGWFLELTAYVQVNQGLDKQMDFFWYYYYPPHTRAAPWLIGILLGYLLSETKQGRAKLADKTTIALLWIISLTALCICVFVGFYLTMGEYNRLANSLHIALVKPVWALAIAWIIFACVNGYGGPVNWFLSLPVFKIVSKLTYSMHLVHFEIVYALQGQMRTFDNIEVMHQFWVYFAPTFLVSIVLTILIEFPMLAIDKYFFGASEKKSI